MKKPHTKHPDIESLLMLALSCLISSESSFGQNVQANPAPSAAQETNQYTVILKPGFSSIANHFDRGSNTVSELLSNVPAGRGKFQRARTRRSSEA